MGRPNVVNLFGAVTSPNPPVPLPPTHNATGKERSKPSFEFVALPYEKRFVTFPGMSYRHRSLLVCSAIGREGARCEERRHEGRWCRRHKEQRIKLHQRFKAFRAAIGNFPPDDLECDVTRIRTLETPRAERLRDVLRTRSWLLRGCFDAHECFQTRFYGDDMDFGNDQYGHWLQRRLNEVEALLCATEERLRELLLSDLGALWILDGVPPSGDVSQFLEACCEYPKVRIQKARLPPSFKKFELAVIPDPVEEALKQKKYAMIIGIWDYIATLCTPPESQLFRERLAIIHAYIARCIVSDPALFLAAETYSSVEDFLTDLDQDIYVWERLMCVLSQPNVHCTRAAIDDVLRPEDDDANNLTFLGGRMYRDLSDAYLPFRAWGHWAVFFPSSCLCAVKEGFATAGAISLFSKFMQLHGVFPPSEYSKSIRSNLEILNLCGIHLNITRWKSVVGGNS
ncbi:hypothetical protein L218DRAFT_939812 [Marasmius fiardii PR-910]|nr:hypothetical protein L218DRAFT_939812 [Marasmius fiardii PR-910]